ncbi:Zinc finger protein 324A [Amphibalanus amphitrite]|uniref:Zinc finger protein 324A n=1 Tax=Amphibalanus amphitrite TaxID=1232801 RepID=A0A6A4V604_AMPAM|nr:Zinc finger protein 324A [Amphibalanus amphitrite]
MDIQSLDKEEPVPYIMSGEGAAPEQVPGVAAEMSIQSLPELGAESTVISELTAETPKASKDAAGLVVLGVAGDYSHDTVTAAVVTGDGPAADALPAEVIGVSSGAVPQPAMTAAAPPAVTQAALEPVARISTEQVSVAMSEPVPIVTIELASGLAPGSEPGVPSTAAAATAVPVNVVPVAISSAVSMPPPSAEAVPIATTIPSTGGAGDNGGLHLADYLENAHIRIEDKLSGIINNDYRLYLHSEVVCDRCHTTLCQIHDLEMQTKHLKDQVVGFFWDTVEPRRAQKRRSSSQSYPLGPEVGVMYTESADGTSPRFRCMLCTNTYSRAAKARDHFIAKHAQIKRFKCTLCSEMFLTYKQKRHHELSHTAEMCTKCGKKYPGNKRGMLERHVAQCGELKRCRVCGAEFQNMSDFIKHRRDAHEKSATCDVCGKVVSARNLASHRAIHSDERNYTCHLCGSSFKAKGSLDTHLRTHSEDRPFSCATCGRSFKHRNNWKDHERGHLNIRDFVCHFCSKSFKQAKNLKQHLRQHDANPEIFTCPHCPSTFRYKYNMLAHVKTLHTGETSRRVRRRMRAPSELSASGSAASGGPAGGTHAVLVGLDPLQLSPGSVTSDSNSGVHVVAAAPAGTAVAAGSRSLPQLNPLNPSVVFMQTLQHHSIFSS